MLETVVRGKSYMPLRTTNAMELLPRIVLSANVSLPIWRSRRTDIPSCPCWQIWLLGCNDLFRWQRCFCNVTHISIQDTCSFNQTIWNYNYGEAYWPCKVCGHFWFLGRLIFHCPYSHRMWHSIFVGHGKISIFIFLTSNKEIRDGFHDLDQN